MPLAGQHRAHLATTAAAGCRGCLPHQPLRPLPPPSQAKGTVQLQREAAERAKQQQQNGAAHSDDSEEGDSGDDSGSDDEGRGQQHHQPQRAGGPQGTVGQLAIPKGVFGAQHHPVLQTQCGSSSLVHPPLPRPHCLLWCIRSDGPLCSCAVQASRPAERSCSSACRRSWR